MYVYIYTYWLNLSNHNGIILWKKLIRIFKNLYNYQRFLQTNNYYYY